MTKSMSIQEAARHLPSVDALLQDNAFHDLIRRHGRQPVVDAARQILDELRRIILNHEPVDPSRLEAASIAEQAALRLEESAKPTLRRVINATGIILHTGLGRSAWPAAAREAVREAAGYSNLQMDLAQGGRMQRETCLRDLIRRLTGVESTALVNNNAAATLLVLAALGRGKEVIVSRGELIEIGGSFRLPDVMRESGAILREVGATNKTHLKDYEQAIGPQTGLILKVNKSNYRLIGFTAEVPIGDLVELGRRAHVPVVHDLGSGALVDLKPFGLPHEPTVQESLQAGADVVFFSTDKLIGGPQGGLILGRPDLVAAIHKHPLYRVLRVDKATLAALEATLRLFLAPERLTTTHPTFALLAKTRVEMETQARSLRDRIIALHPDWQASVVEDVSYLGGGTLPEEALPTFAVKLIAGNRAAADLSRELRLATPPVVPRIRDDTVLLDMRTVFPDEIDDIAQAMARLQA